MPVEPACRIRTPLVAMPICSAKPMVDLMSDGETEIGGKGRLRGGRDVVVDEGD